MNYEDEEDKVDQATSESESYMRKTYTSDEMTVQSSQMERTSDHTIDSNTTSAIEGKISQKYGTIPEDYVKEETEEDEEEEWIIPPTNQVQNVQTDKVISRN